jgi:mono/diheme cytochrome c family protein
MILRLAVLVFAAALAVQAGAAATSLQTPAQKRTTRDRVYTKEQATRGGPQYTKLCESCHNPAKVPAGKKPGPPTVGAEFLETWKDRSLGELLTLVRTTMPNDGSAFLNEEETADIVAYVLQLNGFPDGPTPLKEDAAANNIFIVK